MWPVASFPQSFPKTFFGKPQSSLLTGSRSCQVSNGIKGSNATDYAGLRLDCTGGPAILFPFFAQSAEEPFFRWRIQRRQFIDPETAVILRFRLGFEIEIFSRTAQYFHQYDHQRTKVIRSQLAANPMGEVV